MIEFKLDPARQTDIKDRFVENDLSRQIRRERLSGSFSATRLFAFINGVEDEAISEALVDDLTLRRTYRTLLRNRASYHIEQAIAASSDLFPDRFCDGCKVRLQGSRADENQYYLIIELADKSRPGPHKLTAFGRDETCAVLDLPDQRNGIVQTIIEADSPLGELLKDPKTEVLLR